jgi:arylsulfatase A-like enzyme
MQKRNVIVVMLDSLQFNYLGCYGNKWIKTPNLDRLAKEGILFENNYIDNLPTVPCRRSMHTGRYSLQYRGWSPLELEETTIADLCWGRPIDTATIYDSAPMRLPKFGYSRGFDKVWFLHGHEIDHDYYAQDPLYHLDPKDFIEDHVLQEADGIMGEPTVAPLLHEIETYLRQRQYWKTDEDQNVAKVMKMAVKYLENIDRGKSFFLWVDSFDPHEPWDPPSVYDPDLKCPYDPDYKGKDMFLPILGWAKIYTEPELNHIRMLYAEKVTMVDKWVGYLLDKVRALGLEDDTLFLLLSDHGEPLGHGEHGHGLMRKCRPWPYEELAHAPMIMRGPSLPAGKRVAGFTQSCDVAPTITEWLGIGVHPSHTGKSLLPLARGEVAKLRDFAIAGYHKYSWAIYTDDWSYIHWRKPDDKAELTVQEEIALGMMGAIASVRGNIKYMSDFTAQDAYNMLKNVIGADAEAIWTGTPSLSAQVPQNDELYDRKADPFQLQNIAGKHEKKAAELYTTLSDFMANLRKT